MPTLKNWWEAAVKFARLQPEAMLSFVAVLLVAFVAALVF